MNQLLFTKSRGIFKRYDLVYTKSQTDCLFYDIKSKIVKKKKFKIKKKKIKHKTQQNRIKKSNYSIYTRMHIKQVIMLKSITKIKFLFVCLFVCLFVLLQKLLSKEPYDGDLTFESSKLAKLRQRE